MAGKPTDVEKIILDVQKKGRDDKTQSQILKDLQALKDTSEKRTRELEGMKALSDEDEEELRVLKGDVLYKTYLKQLTDKERAAFIGKPVATHHIILEEPSLRPDKMYFWLLDFISSESSLGFKTVYKADESTAFGAMSQYGNQFQQVRGGKQQVAQQYLKTISEVMRSLFPLLYEIKQSDELLALYEAADRMGEFGSYEEMQHPKSRKHVENYFAAERTLRDKWATEADGGKLFTLARPQQQQGPGYVLLPHWFFTTKLRHPKEDETWPEVISESIERLVEEKKITREIANVLGNFLLRFKIWQQESYKQLKATRSFKVSFLRQQYANIRLYVEWLKPMLHTIRDMLPKLGRNSPYRNHPERNPYLYESLDTTQMMIDLVAVKESEEDIIKAKKKYYQVAIITLTHRTSMLTFKIGGQNQNIPFGANDIRMDGYIWTKEQIDFYLEKKAQEEFDILEALFDSLDDVKDQIETYLKEGIDTDYAKTLKRRYGEDDFRKIKGSSRDAMSVASLVSPFGHLFGGLRAGFMPFLLLLQPLGFSKKDDSAREWAESIQKDSAGKIKGLIFTIYDVFKKAHRCTTW